MPSYPRQDHTNLPVGTVMTFQSVHDRTFKVKLLAETHQRSVRYVQVLTAPYTYSEHVIMCVVPANTQVSGHAQVYAAALPDVGVGDTVYLIDISNDGSTRPFTVKRLKV